jgi:hypothetical protein
MAPTECLTQTAQIIIQSRNLELSLSYPSFPRKREPRDFSHLLLGLRFRGDDELACPQDFLTASKAAVQGLPLA